MNTNRPELKPEEKKELFLLCYAAWNNNVTEACRMVGVHRKTYYYWIKDDPNFAAQVEDVEGETVDSVTNALKLLALGVKTYDKDGEVFTMVPSLSAIKYFLDHKGKKEGYGKTKGNEQGKTTGDEYHWHLHAPPEPKTLADWEVQVAEAREKRRLAEEAEAEAVEKKAEENERTTDV